VSDREDEWILLRLGKLEELLCQGPRCMHLSVHHLPVPEAGKRREQLWSATDLFGQLEGPCMDVFDGLRAANETQRRAEN
jgi:hypothetical protein